MSLWTAFLLLWIAGLLWSFAIGAWREQLAKEDRAEAARHRAALLDIPRRGVSVRGPAFVDDGRIRRDGGRGARRGAGAGER